MGFVVRSRAQGLTFVHASKFECERMASRTLLFSLVARDSFQAEVISLCLPCLIWILFPSTSLSIIDLIRLHALGRRGQSRLLHPMQMNVSTNHSISIRRISREDIPCSKISHGRRLRELHLTEQSEIGWNS